MLAFCQVNVLNEYGDDDDDWHRKRQEKLLKLLKYKKRFESDVKLNE